MKVLMLSSDPNILVEGTEAHERMRWYGTTFDELHIAVLTKLSFVSQKTSYEVKLRKKLILYPVAARWRIVGFCRLYRMMRRVVPVARPDVITAQGPDEIGLIGYLVARRFRIPLQLQIHTDIFSKFYRRVSLKEFLRYWIAIFLIPRADCMRVVSERIKQSLWEYGVRSTEYGVTVLPVYTDVGRFREAPRDPAIDQRFHDYAFKIIAVGRFMDKEKNFSMLIGAMEEFVKIAPRVILVIVGDGPDKKNYELRIMNYGLKENIIIESWRNDLPSFYKSFDLYVMTSNYEGWGRTVIEAMAAGLPVVMTDVGLAGEVVKNGENGVVVPVGNKEALCTALTAIYRDKEKRARYSEAGRETVIRLSLTRDDYLKRYAEALDQCGGK
ncbi:MAG: glycosyltransferase family 4 protein [Patescibacteria group bacterium]